MAQHYLEFNWTVSCYTETEICFELEFVDASQVSALSFGKDQIIAEVVDDTFLLE